MDNRHPDLVRLTFRAGRLRAAGWPAPLRRPFGLEPRDGAFEGPARLRWRVRAALEEAGVRYLDPVSSGLPGSWSNDESPGLQGLRQGGCRGLLLGWSDAARVELVAGLARTLARPTLVAVVDSAAESRWRDALAEAGATTAHAVGIARMAREMHWRGSRHDALVVDTPELMRYGELQSACDASAALARVGLPGRIDQAMAERWAPLLGPLIAGRTRTATATRIELRVPLPAAGRDGYEAAWHTFLRAYDRFVAVAGPGGFGAFVRQARGDPLQRPALHAWHAALRLAAWHENKATLVAGLLRRHRGESVLVFTPDRRSAYEIAERHLIPALTSEIPRRERDAMLRAFGRGTIRALVGPRLLDVGIAADSVDVGILAGSGHGRDQREARRRRVRPNGLIYELTSIDTVEVGRARRSHSEPADRTVVLHDR